MTCQQTLSSLPVGKCAVVRDIKTEYTQKQRLRELGLIDGAAVEAVFRSPSGDPTAYLICGAMFALRNSDAEAILVEEHQ